MSTVRFRAGDVALELSGSESFVLRQLQHLSPFLGRVDVSALEAATESAEEPLPPDEGPPVEPQEALAVPGPNGGKEAGDGFLDFVRSHPPQGRDRQSDAALLFAYYLQRKAGLSALRVGDLLRCCIRAGVDTRNFNRALGTLSRRGLIQPGPGQSYRISEQGVAAVETRME